MNIVYQSKKTYTHAQGLSCAFRQWGADSHCRFLHGYALQVEIVFEAQHLDARNWVVDFGGMKHIKDWLHETFDHKTLVAQDDPKRTEFQRLEQAGVIQLKMVEATGCEAFAKMIFEKVEAWLNETGLAERVAITSVEIREHTGNAARVCNASTHMG